MLAVSVPVLLVAEPSYASNPLANYTTTVKAISPAVPGVTATSPKDGNSITVTNTSTTEVIVEGYQGEPYLKITNAGVWQNEESPAVYLNKEAFIDNIPSGVDASKPPKWTQLSSSNHATWHDHRIHWMGASVPPVVDKDPHHSHLIKRWDIPITAGETQAKITGTLTWAPTSSLKTNLTYGAVAVAVVAGGGLMVWDRRRRRLQQES